MKRPHLVVAAMIVVAASLPSLAAGPARALPAMQIRCLDQCSPPGGYGDLPDPTPNDDGDGSETPNPSDVCDGMRQEPDVHAALTSFYSNLRSTAPFPNEEPAAIPACPPADPPPAAPQGALDVAFGDSYISGEGAASFDSSPLTAPGGLSCHDATTAWPYLVYNKIITNFTTQAPFQNWACAGATIASTQSQISAAIDIAGVASSPRPLGLGPDTHSVQVSVVGNDLGFADKLSCAYNPTANNKTRMVDRLFNLCIPDLATMQALASAQQNRLVGVYKQIAAAAPNAVIEVAPYPFIFPVDSTKCRSGLSKADEVAANKDFLAVDNMIASAVEQAAASKINIRYLPFDTALTKANVCPTRGTNIHGVNVMGNSDGGGIGGLFHPNAAGHQALRAAYATAAAGGFFGFPGQATPALADGTMVSDESTDSVYVAAGGALVGFANPGEVTAAGNPADFGATIQPLAPGQVGGFLPTPRDGTLLRDASTGDVYVITGGSKTQSGATAGAVTVPSRYLADIPDAAPSTAPAVLGDPTGARQVFFNSGGQLVTVGTDTAGTWSGPVTLAPDIIGSPTATGDPGGVMEVFFNSGGQLQHMRFENGAWGAPAVLGGPITGNPAVVRNAAAGLFEVYFNSGGLLNVVWQANNQWNGPTVLGGPIFGSPAAIASTTTLAREVYFNSDDRLVAMWVDPTNSGWNGPGPLGAAITGSPMAMGNPSGARQVFFNSGGLLNEVWVDTTATQWNGPLNFGVPITGTPAGLGTPVGPWEVYFNSGGQLNVLWQAGHQWNGPGVIAGSITGSPAAIVKYTNGSREILYPSGPSLATMWITTSNFTGNWTGPAAVYTP